MGNCTVLIPQNIAPLGVRRIGVYNVQGNRVGQIPLGCLLPPDMGEKLYSFGALSDVHIVYATASVDFKRALTYLNEEEDVAFVCISGDLTDNGTEDQIQQYKAVVDQYSPNTPVYAVAGNHESYQTTSSTFLSNYTGHPLYYTFTHGDDVFIMVGVISGDEGNLFADGELQWLYETLEANRNKRCFLFEHIPPEEGCGDILGLYSYTKLRVKTESTVFKSLLAHYRNTVYFHGHTHMKYYLQQYGDMANYDHVFGCHSIHIPSLAVPRDVNVAGNGYTSVYADSEGYVVDVYDNGIHLRGRDFVKGEFLPIASYWLDTTLQTIPANTYQDSTGTIIGTAPVTYTNQIPLSINSDGGEFVGTNGEDGYKYGYRLNSAGAEVVATNIGVTGFIPIKKGDTVYLKNCQITPSATGGYADHTYLAFYDASFTSIRSMKFNQQASNDSYFTDLTTDPTTGYLTSFVVNDRNDEMTNKGMTYMRLSCQHMDSNAVITVNEPIE